MTFKQFTVRYNKQRNGPLLSPLGICRKHGIRDNGKVTPNKEEDSFTEGRRTGIRDNRKVLFESILFAFPTHIIFRDSHGSPMAREFTVVRRSMALTQFFSRQH